MPACAGPLAIMLYQHIRGPCHLQLECQHKLILGRKYGEISITPLLFALLPALAPANAPGIPAAVFGRSCRNCSDSGISDIWVAKPLLHTSPSSQILHLVSNLAHPDLGLNSFTCFTLNFFSFVRFQSPLSDCSCLILDECPYLLGPSFPTTATFSLSSDFFTRWPEAFNCSKPDQLTLVSQSP